MIRLLASGFLTAKRWLSTGIFLLPNVYPGHCSCQLYQQLCYWGEQHLFEELLIY